MIRARSVAYIVLVTSGLTACVAQRPAPGGYGRVPVTDEGVMRAAAFAAEAQRKVMQDPNGAPVRLEAVAVTEAEQQVVAGMNYRIKLKVKLDGVEKDAVAVVWWQPWRKPEQYRLTSWTWK